MKRERKGGVHSGSSSWRAKKGGGRGEGRVRKLVWLAEQLFTPLSPLHHHPPLLSPFCFVFCGDDREKALLLRVGIDRGPSRRALRPAHIGGTLQRPQPPPLSLVSSTTTSLYFFLVLLRFLSRTLFVSFMWPGDSKITVWRRFGLYLPERFLRRGVESTAGLTIQTWMNTQTYRSLIPSFSA